MPQGFKIASAWVEIKADTTGLRRDAESGVRRALAGIDAKIRLAADATGLRAQVRAAAKKAGAGESATIKIKTDFNVAEARAKLMAGIKGLKLNADVDINPDIDAALMKAKIKAEVDALKGRFTVPVTPDINTTEFAAKLQAAARTVAASDTDIPVDLNPRINRLKLRAEAAAAAATVRAAVTFNADLDTAMLHARVAAAVAALNAMPHNLHFRATVDVDRSRLTRALDEVNKAFDNSGGHIGRWTKIVLAIGTLGPPAIAACLPAIEALGTASLGLVPALTSVVLTFGAIAVGGNGVVNAITASTKGAKQFKEAMSHLTPTAQSFVKAIITSKGAFHDLQQSVQNVLFSGLDDSFRALANTIVPDLEVGLGGMAMQLNDMTKLSLSTITNLSRMGLLKTMFGGLQIAMDPIVKMPSQFLDIMTKVTIAATPLWIRMTQSMGRGMDNLVAKVNKLFDSGLLQAKISKAGDDIVNFFKRVSNNPEWQQFKRTMKETGPEMVKAFGDIAEAILKLINDAGPLAGMVIKIAAAFARFVSSLPDSLVTTLMSVYLGMKLIGGLGSLLKGIVGTVVKLGAAIRVLVSQQAMLAAIGPALQRIGMSSAGINRTAGALSFLGKGVAALGVAALGAYALKKIGDAAKGAAPDIEKMGEALTILASSGELTGELSKNASTFNNLSDSLSKLEAKKIGFDNLFKNTTGVETFDRALNKGMGTALNFVDKLAHGSKSLEAVSDDFKSVDKAMAEMVNSGNADTAAEAFKALEDRTDGSKEELGKLTKALPQYQDALKAAKAAQDLAARTMGTFGDRAVNTQGRLKELQSRVDGLKDSLFALNNVNRDANEAQADMVDAAKALTDSATEHAGALKFVNGQLQITNQAQSEAVRSVDSFASSVESAGLAIYQQTGSWTQAQKVWESGRGTLIKNLQTMGLTGTQAEQVASSVLKIPSQKDINMQIKGNIKADLDGVAAAFRASPSSKTIKVSVLSEQAERILEDMGFKVTHLKDGSFEITANSKGAKDELTALDRYKVKDKDLKIKGDNSNAMDKIEETNAKRIDGKTGKINGDSSFFDRVFKNVQGQIVKTKTGHIKGDSSSFNGTFGIVQGKKVSTKTGHIRGEKSGFDSVVRSIATMAMPSRTVSIFAKKVGSVWNSLFGATGGAVSNLKKGYTAVPGFADGGSIAGQLLEGPGSKTSDSILARLSRGEFVMQARAVDKYGLRFMDMINRGGFPRLPGFASGGKAPKGDVQSTTGVNDLIGLVTVSALTQKAINRGSKIDNETMAALRAQDSLADLLSGLQSTKNGIMAAFKGKTETNLVNKLYTTADKLIPLQQNLDKVNKSLESANDTLDDLKQSFDQMKSSVSSNIVAFGDITKAGKYGTSVNTLINQLQNDTNKAKQFDSMLAQLKAKGLNSQAISEIAAAGLDNGGLATAQTLLTASSADIAQINKLQSQLQTAADSAGTTVANAMYGAGIQAAQGLVNGLQSQQDSIEAQMRVIAQSMENAIKSALGIHSPSKVMMGLGSHVAEGFALGIEGNDRPMLASRRMAQQSPAAVTSAPTATGGGIVINGGITVCVEGTFDLTDAQQRKNIANNLAGEIVKATRRYDRARS